MENEIKKEEFVRTPEELKAEIGKRMIAGAADGMINLAVGVELMMLSQWLTNKECQAPSEAHKHAREIKNSMDKAENDERKESGN
jgi:hypothetical protein